MRTTVASWLGRRSSETASTDTAWLHQFGYDHLVRGNDPADIILALT